MGTLRHILILCPSYNWKMLIYIWLSSYTLCLHLVFSFWNLRNSVRRQYAGLLSSENGRDRTRRCLIMCVRRMASRPWRILGNLRRTSWRTSSLAVLIPSQKFLRWEFTKTESKKKGEFRQIKSSDEFRQIESSETLRVYKKMRVFWVHKNVVRGFKIESKPPMFV